ncbi:MAG TPA: 5-carboxymethyl-2-hydroxymuconate isomerase, partial [Gammaproteobacteria bacterium]|nr:5-carboxymethyl-2-hydroxymuconate isomerase [Gammaproteobacteria bacterium]
MKLVTFTHGGDTRIGVVVGELVVDLSKAVPELPTNMRDFLVAGDAAMTVAREAQT